MPLVALAESLSVVPLDRMEVIKCSETSQRFELLDSSITTTLTWSDDDCVEVRALLDLVETEINKQLRNVEDLEYDDKTNLIDAIKEEQSRYRSVNNHIFVKLVKEVEERHFKRFGLFFRSIQDKLKECNRAVIQAVDAADGCQLFKNAASVMARFKEVTSHTKHAQQLTATSLHLLPHMQCFLR